MPRNLKKEEFILKAKNIHGEKYDYKDVLYIAIIKNTENLNKNQMPI